MGVFSLTPQGTLRWATPENYDRPIVILQEIVFSPSPQSRLYFHANDHLRGIGLDGTPLFTYVDGLPQDNHQTAVAPDGSLYTNLFSAFGPGLMMGKFDDSGNLLWHVFDQFSNSTNVLSVPDVGPDGVIYNGRNLNTLYAINPDSSVRWQYTDSESLMIPIVSPLNDLIFCRRREQRPARFLRGGEHKGQLAVEDSSAHRKRVGRRSRSVCARPFYARWTDRVHRNLDCWTNLKRLFIPLQRADGKHHCFPRFARAQSHDGERRHGLARNCDPKRTGPCRRSGGDAG